MQKKPASLQRKEAGMKNTLLTNKGVTQPQKIFGSWKSASDCDFRTTQGWRESGRGVPKKATPTALLDDGERVCNLFHRSQTKQMKRQLTDRWTLIRRFVKPTPAFGYWSQEKNHVRQLPSNNLWGNVPQLVYKSLDYKNRSRGVRISTKSRHTDRADKIYLLAPSVSNWFVFDLDNHWPTLESTIAHLKLLKHLVAHIQDLQKVFGAMSVFYDYQQDCPRGIHIWVSLKNSKNTKTLHAMARQFLESIKDPALDKELIKNGLTPIGQLEILPSEKLLMQFFGSAGREVFTTTRLKPVNEAFDSTSLLDHIFDWNCGGDPTERYDSLALLTLDQPHHIHSIPAVNVEPQVALCGISIPSQQNNYFTGLIDLCLRGVMVPDELFTSCIRPLATALWFRDLHDHPEKKKLINTYLLEWLQHKHNGNVSRIPSGDTRSLMRQISCVVNHVHKSPDAVQAYWKKVRSNDLRYPHRTLSLIGAMQAEWNPAVVISQSNIGQVQQLVGENKDNSRSGISYHCIGGHFTSSPHPEIPQSVLDHLDKALLLNNQRKGKAYNRKRQFCVEFIKLIGPTGNKRLNQNKLNQIGGYQLNAQPKTLRRYKELLRKANILKPGSYRTLKRNELSSLYELADWVVEAWSKQPPTHRQNQ
jgi:hypothetical protein